jgi:carbon-monoxide dehydrogenase medium subunit
MKAYPMTNTRILLSEFEYLQPHSLSQALALKAEYGNNARLIAGGTNLIVQMKQDRISPQTVLDISKVPNLSSVLKTDDGLTVGGLAPIRKIRSIPAVQSEYQALADACAAFGSMQIQTMGTIGGNLCNGSPASDSVPALMVFDAKLVLSSVSGQRKVKVEDFLVKPGETAIRQDEILTHVKLPKQKTHTGSAYIKISRVEADLAKVSVAAVIVRENDRIVDCKLAFGSVAPTVIRAKKAEQFLIGKTFSEAVGLEAGELAKGEVSPVDDMRSTAWYRREIVKTITHDVLSAAWERSAEQRESCAAENETIIAENDTTIHVESQETHPIELVVNGEKHRLLVEPNELLLNLIRDRLGLTGAKYGCGIGECGACTVLLNGMPALSCLTLAIAADGCQITTVEGLQSSDGELHPLQESFLDNQAFQCGYCTPGMLIMSKSLLEDIPAPDENQIREYLRGNRCRCTGFASIVRAVHNCVGHTE